MSRPSPQTDRLVAVVDMLVAGTGAGGLSQSEIARRLGVSPATCYPMLASLERAGWLRRHPSSRTYALGPALIAAGLAASAGMDALGACRPRLADLQRRLGLAALALVPSDEYATVAFLALDPRGPGSALRVGDQIPFHPPLGATFMAFRTDAAVDRWLARGGVTSPEDRGEYLEILRVIRWQGFSIELAPSLDERMRRQLVTMVRARPDYGAAPDDGPARGNGVPPGGAPVDGVPRDGGEYDGGARDGGALRPLLLELAEGLGAATDLVAASLDPGRSYRIDSVSAPVFDAHGDVTLLVLLRGFSGELPGEMAESLGGQLSAVTAEITADIAGRTPGRV